MPRATATTRAAASTRTTSSQRLAVRNFPYVIDQDGTGDFVDFGNVYAFERTDPFTLMGFFRLAIDAASNVRLHSKTTAAGTQGYAINIDTVDGKFRVYLQNSSGNRIIKAVNTPPEVGVNYFFAVSYDGSSDQSGVNIALVKVGAQLTGFAATTTTSNTLSATMVTTTALRLGARADAALSFNGDYQAMSVCTTALSLAEIQDYYYNNKRPASMASLWLAEGGAGSGTAVNDEIGSNNGTITGATWATTSMFLSRSVAT